MTNEEYLLKLIRGTTDGLSEYIIGIDMSGNKTEKAFRDGEHCAMCYAIQAIQKALKFYKVKVLSNLRQS